MLVLGIAIGLFVGTIVAGFFFMLAIDRLDRRIASLDRSNASVAAKVAIVLSRTRYIMDKIDELIAAVGDQTTAVANLATVIETENATIETAIAHLGDAGNDPRVQGLIDAVRASKQRIVDAAQSATNENTRLTDALGTTPGTAPSVTGFEPSSGAVGDVVLVHGANFTPDCTVSFGGSGEATPTSSTAEAIEVAVPADAVSGTIKVTNSIGSGESTDSFSVNTPAATG